VVQNIVHYMMDFVFGRLLIRALADAIVLFIFMVFPIHHGQGSFPPFPPPVRGLLVPDR